MRPRSIFRFLTTLLLSVVATFDTPTAASHPAVHRAGDIVTEAGFVTTDNDVRVAYEIGTLFVPENRMVAGSRIIGIGFARVRAKRATGAPPVFILPGGPGRSYLNAFTDDVRLPGAFWWNSSATPRPVMSW